VNKKLVKIKLRTGLATDRGAFDPGAIVQWDEADALRLVDKGFAEFVEEPKTEAKA